MTTLLDLDSQNDGSDKSISLCWLLKRISSDIIESDGYAFLEHHVLELDNFVDGGCVDGHSASRPISFILTIDSAVGGDLQDQDIGSITLNDEKLEEQLLKVIFAYSMQDNLLYAMLIVEETLMCSME
ncbi:hypothetical protein BHM03_00018812 [Ensete ventricosum]|nr:hypothetical protein BHM03_00018812 [Ensete ventricosum]